MYINHLKEH